MFGVVYSYALKDFLRFSRLIAWLILGGLTFLLGAVWQRLMPGSTPSQSYGDVSTLMVFRILPLASAIFSTSVISQEVEQKTIVYLLTRTVPRPVLLLGRYAASVTVVALVSAFTAILLSVSTFHSGALGNALLWRDLGSIGLAALAYGSLFTFVSLLFNRAMLVCLLFAFGWETSVPNMPGAMGRVSLVTYVQALASHPPLGGDSKLLAFATATLSNQDVSPAIGGAVLSCVFLLGLVAAVGWFRTHEFVARDDAE